MNPATCFSAIPVMDSLSSVEPEGVMPMDLTDEEKNEAWKRWRQFKFLVWCCCWCWWLEFGYYSISWRRRCSWNCNSRGCRRGNILIPMLMIVSWFHVNQFKPREMNFTASLGRRRGEWKWSLSNCKCSSETWGYSQTKCLGRIIRDGSTWRFMV